MYKDETYYLYMHVHMYNDQCPCVLIIIIVLYKWRTTINSIKMNSVLNSSQQVAIQQQKTQNLRKSNIGI